MTEIERSEAPRLPRLIVTIDGPAGTGKSTVAGELARRTGLRLDLNALKRARFKRPQVGLTRDQRRRNLSGAFLVPRRRHAAVEGRNVLLVDDVITTGATAEACARALKRAGAARVDVLALALVTSEVLASV